MQLAINEEHMRKAEPTIAEIGFVWFHRIIAVNCILFAASYWMRLIGLVDSPLALFNHMPVHWQVAATSLAVLYPVAATGLWMVVSWGAVIWLAVAIAELVMFGLYSDLFGTNTTVIIGHLATVFLYVAFRLALYREKRARNQ